MIKGGDDGDIFYYQKWTLNTGRARPKGEGGDGNLKNNFFLLPIFYCFISSFCYYLFYIARLIKTRATKRALTETTLLIDHQKN